MTIEGINLTPALIENIKWYQQNDGTMENSLKVFDSTISYIAKENDGAKPEQAVIALRLISELCYIKEIFATLNGEEVKNV
ncbi:hypothetical protein [Parabacteroides provencensis]|uniref:hypothetical protein n=1 Tax=Parabacteroides provencensis TaxID=1944636 RepID=UPI000C15C8C4|nr:hypothetical protein [Parabacteroides provencensis]